MWCRGVTTRRWISCATTTSSTCKARGTANGDTWVTQRRCYTSVNHVARHPVAPADALNEGDIVNIDVAVEKTAGTATPAVLF